MLFLRKPKTEPIELGKGSVLSLLHTYTWIQKWRKSLLPDDVLLLRV